MSICGAKSKQHNHRPCRQPAMANGRCRLHGGKSLIKHGYYSNKSKQERKRLKELYKQMKQNII